MKELYNKLKTIIIFILRLLLFGYRIPYIVALVGKYTYLIPRHLALTGLCQKLLQGRIYEFDTIQAIRREYDGGTIIHAGAYIGDMLPFLNEIGKVIAFEPVPLYFRFAKANITINALQRVNIYNIGLSHRRERKHIQLVNNKGNYLGGSAMVSDKGAEVSLQPLDTFTGLGKVDIIHLDLEGYEISALTGARLVIMEDSPVVIVEHGNYIKKADYDLWFSKLNYSFAYEVDHNLVYKNVNCNQQSDE